MALDTYNRVFTMHGIVMVFFVLIPANPAVIGDFVLPMMLGARDLAFRKINLLSWYCNVVGGCAPLIVTNPLKHCSRKLAERNTKDDIVVSRVRGWFGSESA